jgi:hypothetical protein
MTSNTWSHGQDKVFKPKVCKSPQEKLKTEDYIITVEGIQDHMAPN